MSAILYNLYKVLKAQLFGGEQFRKISFLKAVGAGNLEAVKEWLETEADVNWFAKDENLKERSPLMVASEKGELDIARYLVGNGAELDKTNESGATAFYIAAQAGQIDVLLFLAEKGADKHKACIDGWTPIHAAAQRGQLAVVR